MAKAVCFMIDEAEIACALVEGLTGVPRPQGLTAREALALLPGEDNERIKAASKAVALYVNGQIQEAMQVTVVLEANGVSSAEEKVTKQ